MPASHRPPLSRRKGDRSRAGASAPVPAAQVPDRVVVCVPSPFRPPPRTIGPAVFRGSFLRLPLQQLGNQTGCREPRLLPRKSHRALNLRSHSTSMLLLMVFTLPPLCHQLLQPGDTRKIYRLFAVNFVPNRGASGPHRIEPLSTI